MIKVSIDCDPVLEPPNNGIVSELVLLTLNNHNFKKSDITIIFGNDSLLTKLKKEFFQKDQLTDVIAFRLNDYELPEIEGEIYISLPRAKENAKLYKETYDKEILRLIVHGCLHLIGFDDRTKLEKLEMTTMENKVLKLFKHENIFED
ncbi:MAG: rRNA maturation RNase YbeY [Fidelibacterota bacterium]|jgi:probable rRNA maturation factor|tara:strand:+ start:15 stop:458 length:444 start_codon:yes stop_codon:yes gene_type:complete